MSYIGKSPSVGNFVKLDALTASATASYTMQVGSVNFTPESVNHMLVSLNGVIQSPTTSYTISGSTLTFASALTSSDSIDFIMVYGNVLDIGTPSDSTISTAKIIDNAVTGAKFNADVISGQTALGAEPADTDEFLVSDAGVLKRIDYSHIKGGGLVLISNYNVSSAVSTITFDNVITSTYKNYLIITSNVKVSHTAKTTFNFRSGGSTLTSNYHQAMSGYRSGNSALEYGNENQTDFTTTIANDIYGGSTYSERMYLYDPKSGTDKRISQLGVFKDSNSYQMSYHGTGVYAAVTTAIDGFILERTSGTFNTNGQVTVYGIKNA